MGRKKAGAAGGKQKTLAQAGAFPLLAKGTSTALGRYCNVPGKYWAGCAAADKQKIFKCLVVDFIAVHDFGGGVKGAGMHVKEMGESGTGSLEVGVASGDVFVIAYPTPFLQFFYDANPEMLPSGMRPVTEGGAGTTASADVDLEGGDEQEQTTKQEKTQKPPVFDFLNPISSTLVTAGRKRGCYSNKYTCGSDADGVQHDRADHFGRYGEPGAQTRGVHAGVHVNATQQAQGAEGEAEERGEGGLEEREE